MATAQATMFGPDPTFGDELDFYETPAWAVDAIVPFIPQPECGRWALIEPAAGCGAMLAPLVEGLEPSSVLAIELHQGRFSELRSRHEWSVGSYPLAACVQGDFLAMSVNDDDVLTLLNGEPRLVVMNPPYSAPRPTIGLEFIEKALEIAAPDGCVAALLPLDFATGVDRCERIHDRYTCSVYPLRRRPHFGGPHSGARPFAWFVWDLGKPKSEWRVIG